MMTELLLDSSLLQQLNDVDTQLLLYLNDFRHVVADYFMWIYTKVPTWIPMYAALIFMLWRNLPLKKLLIALLCVGVVILLCDQVCSHLIRPWVQRLRPANLENPISPMVDIVNGYRGGRYSFPSAHAANSFGLAFYLAFLMRHKLLTFTLMLWAIINCYSRIYLGVHYPGDLLVGFLIGLVAAAIGYYAFCRLAGKGSVGRYVKAVQVPICTWLVTVLAILTYSVIMSFV